MQETAFQGSQSSLATSGQMPGATQSFQTQQPRRFSAPSGNPQSTGNLEFLPALMKQIFKQILPLLLQFHQVRFKIIADLLLAAPMNLEWTTN